MNRMLLPAAVIAALFAEPLLAHEDDAAAGQIQNLLGYAYRNAGQLDSAFKHYQRALELNPRHRGAREYLGEAYLLANDVQKAQEQLAALRQICLIPCEEYEDLEKAITAYSKRAARSR